MCTLSTGWSLVSTSYKTTTTTLLRPFNGLFSRTTWVSRYQKDKTSLDLNEARDYTFLRMAMASAGPYAKQSAPKIAPDR